MALIAAWRAYKRGIIGLADLRVWLAIFEAVARRCGVRGNRRPRFVGQELADIVGVRVEHIRRSIRRLERAGFLRWSETAVYLDDGTALLSAEELDDLERVADLLVNRRRKVPVPRRMLRAVCRMSRPVLIATALGHFLRCLYYRDGRCCPDGRCKSSWVAAVFGVDARNVKAARGELVKAGWLIMEGTDQCSMNRWGPRVRVNLHCKPTSTEPACKSPPRPPAKPLRLPPPEINKKLPKGSNNQKPAGRGPSGISDGNATKGPRWEHVVLPDLCDAERLQRLFERACVSGAVRRTRSALLEFFVAAEYSRAVAARNPCGLFASLVRKRRWGLGQRYEDTARQRIAALDELGLVQRLFDDGDCAGKPSRGVRPEHAPSVECSEGIRALISRSLSACL